MRIKYFFSRRIIGSKLFLKNNEDPFITDFIVLAGDLNEIHITLPLPKDSDGDGIMDDFDACPQVPGVPNKDPNLNGCPIPKSCWEYYYFKYLGWVRV